MRAMSPSRQPPARAVARQARLLTEVTQILWQVVSQERQPADAALAQLFRNHKEYGARDRRLLANGAFAFFRWKGWLDQLQIPDWGIALATACLMDKYVDEPAVQSLIEHARTMGFDPEATLQRTRQLPLARLFPDWLVDSLPENLSGADAFAQLALAMQQRPPAWLRCRRGRHEDLFASLARNKVNALQHPRVTDAISIASPVNLDLIRKDTGPAFEVQDLASQCVGLICDPKPGQRWWDVCAGAGGKSLHLADLMQNQGQIFATDVREPVLRELEQRARRAQVTIISAHLAGSPSRRFADSLFDGVLVDAPCSGIGTWSRNPDARWRTMPAHVEESARKQTQILDEAAPRVKPGGTLVYSVCTLTQRETSDATGSFLERHPEFEPEKFSDPLVPSTSRDAALILPTAGPCIGMYVARLKRRLRS
jgi:16S rRNA (cytosine967-C5)-methyltransferase